MEWDQVLVIPSEYFALTQQGAHCYKKIHKSVWKSFGENTCRKRKGKVGNYLVASDIF